ncbi:MAG: mechanosensitive ion channel domain-containing protein, partial [Nanoarchaeota archaeon]
MITDLLLFWFNSLLDGTSLDNKYAVSVTIMLFFAAAGKLLLFIYGQYLERFASKTKTKVDDMLFEHTKKPLFYLLLAYGLKLILLNLEFSVRFDELINTVMAVVFLYVLLRGFDILIETWALAFSKKTKTSIDDVLLPLFHKILKVLFVIIGLLWVLRIWHIDITPYLAGVGISGLVLGLALQDSLKNIFGGVTLLLDKTYLVGDKVQLESGEVGIIHDIGLRSTKMVTFDNEVIYVPNGYLANSRVMNYARPDPKVRTNVVFGVEYGSDVEKVRKIVLDVIKGIDGIMAE